MKISASIYSNRTKPLPELVEQLDQVGVDFFHVDCNNDAAVFKDIAFIHAHSQTPVDLHIIAPHTEPFAQEMVRTQPAQVCFQLEDLKDPPRFPKGFKGRKGLAIVSQTPLEVLEPYVESLDFVLFMTTTPGQSGGSFNRENFQKIRRFKAQHGGVRVHVDGGVNDQVAFVLRSMGVSLVVSGSFLVNADMVGRALHNLRNTDTESPINVGDFMIGRLEAPVLAAPFTFHQVLQSIEEGRLGFTMVEDSQGAFAGIISNADVRRGLLRQLDAHRGIDDLDPSTLINAHPAVVQDTQSVAELLHLVRSVAFPVIYLPVLDQRRRVAGCLTFNNLIKGEL